MLTPTSRQIAFAKWLAGLEPGESPAAGRQNAHGRGTLAALRRGLMLDEEHLYELFAQIPPYLLTDLRADEQPLYLMVAALFGYHPLAFKMNEGDGRHYDFGDAMRALAEKQARAGDDASVGDLLPEPLKRRMEALLAAPRADLFGHLRTAVGLLKNAEVPIDWALLLCHLQAWEWRDRPVQWQWSRSFYVGHPDKQEGDENHVS